MTFTSDLKVALIVEPPSWKKCLSGRDAGQSRPHETFVVTLMFDLKVVLIVAPSN